MSPSNAAALMRAHPQYQAPETLQAAICSVPKREGFWAGNLSLYWLKRPPRRFTPSLAQAIED